MTSMKIMKFIDLGFEAGGAEKSVRLASEGLRKRGHEVVIVATDHLWAGQPLFADTLLPAISGGTAGRFASHLWYRDGYRLVRRLLAESRPDCVHFHTVGGFSPSLIAATRGYPRVMYAHGPEDWMLRLSRWNLPSATEPSGLSSADRLRYLHLRFVQRPAYRLWLRGIDAAAPVSEFMARSIAADLPKVPIRVIANTCEDGYAPLALRDPNRVVFLGRLSRVKGVDVLIDAFRRVSARNPEARLAVVGEGPDRTRLEGLAGDLIGSGRVAFTGWLDRAGIIDQLGASGLVAVPSLWPEAFGRVVLDAYSCGRPVVASRIGGLPELVGPDTGLLVEPGDAAGLAEALGRLLGDSETLRRLGRNAADRAADFSLDRITDEHEQLSLEAIATHGS
jgi:glycosyltransferase involved in cell wall biosynthesis